MAKTEENKEILDIIKQLKKVSKSSSLAYVLGEENSPSDVKHWLPTGIKVLDVIISNNEVGGFPSGRICELYGDPSSGKSLLALLTAKKVLDDGGYVIWCDTENSFSETLCQLFGVNTSQRFLYTQPTCIDEVFMIVEQSILSLRQNNQEKKLLIVWDSVAQTPTRIELEEDYGKKSIALAPRELSQGFRKILGMIGKLNCVFLCLNQVRANIGNQWEPLTTPGGYALPFAASIRIHLHKSSLIKNGEDVVGNKIKAKVVKSKVGPSYRTCEFKMYYTRGVDELESVFDILVDSGFITQKGGWYTIEGIEKQLRKLQIIEMLKSDKEFYEKAMQSFYKEMIRVYDANAKETYEDDEGNVRDPDTGELLYNSLEVEKVKQKVEDNKVIQDE